MPTAHQLFKNNADSTVNGTIAIGASFFNVAPGHGHRFPTPSAGQYFLATLFEKNVGGDEINFEIVKVTSVTGDTLTVVRDFEGIVVGNGGTSGGWAYPSAVGINPSQIVYVHLRLTAYGAGNALAKDGNLEGLESAAAARANLGISAANTPNTPTGNIAATTVQAALYELDAEKVQITSPTGAANMPVGTEAQRPTVGEGLFRYNSTTKQFEGCNGLAWSSVGGASVDPFLFYKANALSTAFTKTGAATLSVKAGTSVMVAGAMQAFAVDTAVVMPALTAGNDYAVYVCTDGTIRADANQSAPSGYTTVNSRKIGGFHYGLVASGTTVAGGSFATTGNGMIWTQGAVDDIAGINKYSLWDLKFRPACSDPRGMALVGGRVWVDIYLCSTDTAANGTSKAGSNIASGTVLPKIPAAFGGNGSTTYPSLNWWVANELARANQKRLMWEHEFVEAAYGVTENQSIDATASTYPTTQRNAGYTSKFGIEQASGHHWTWGQDSNFYSEAASPAYSWKTVTGNTGAAGSERGQTNTAGTYGLSRVILGGSRTNGAYSGSRASVWGNYPWISSWSVGLRAAADHLQLL